MKYFFHLEDGACIRDPKGEEFPDDAAALLEAARVAQELSKLRVHAYEWRVVVKNADRRSRRFGAANTSPRRTRCAHCSLMHENDGREMRGAPGFATLKKWPHSGGME
jgi:hypothetical protein